MRFIIPQVLAGNAIVLKHAPNVLLSAKSLLRAIENTKLPAGYLQLALIEIEDCEKYICEDCDVVIELPAGTCFKLGITTGFSCQILNH
jgi:acyl-CoA reductase-like NAD-dependent aldehyde dehydrogenase